ncbi:MAG: ABC transporter permease [Nitrospinae bacterium]|nr:ABC transporter permease [Nitrospinota bacterium]
MNLKRLSIAFAFLTLFLYGGLIGSLFYFYRGPLFLEALFSDRTLFSIRLSLATATIATIISVAVAVPSAYALSRFDFPGKRFIDTLLEFPMIVSPAALGAMILIFFSTPLGEVLQERTVQFVFAFAGIVLAQFVTTAGVATRLLKAALDETPRRYEEVARSLGASPFQAFFTITLPLAKRGIIASVILTWAKALGEFGATITVAGSMAMKTETLPIAIFMRLSGADIEGSAVLILILVSIGFAILYGTRFLTEKTPHA